VNQVRVVIADDHVLFRQGLRTLLEARGIEVIGEADDGAQAVQLAHHLHPDIVLSDLSMPGMGGLDAARLISTEEPQVRVVILTASEDDANLFEAIKAGAQGYLLKNARADTLVAMLEGVHRGEPALTPNLAQKLLREFAHPTTPSPSHDLDALTAREREVLELLVQGITSNHDLAEHLIVSENTVKYHLRNIMDKLHLQNRAQVVGHALRHGLVDSQ
jgi:DNA-binding NarL/FixJ family response regulator